ncbi:MAG: glycosyltransferase family 4 protein [Candidatus Moranbacteria bacterium]|nr:glycosyltransferase family 4 protein [Candidatus Moranbacteria bacterium]
MKIAFIGQKGIPAKFGGVERHVEELAKRLAAQGHEVFVYTRNNYTDRKLKHYEGVKLIHLPSIPTKHLDAISHTFLSAIHAIFSDYDVIHFHSIGPSSLAFLIRIFKPRTKLVATYHCQDYFHQKWGFLARLYLKFGEFMICRVPHQTITVSLGLTEYAKNKMGKETVFIPNGMSVSPAEENDELRKFRLEPNGYILSVSRLIKHKGIHYLIEAFKNLEDQGLTESKKLVLVGDGFFTDNYVSYLRRIANGRKSILFIGNQSGETLRQLFTHAYCFVQPSESEGLSLALLEAMGYGKATLVSNIAENLEAVRKIGASFESGNVKSLEKNLAELLTNQEKVEKMGQALQEIANRDYNWDRIAMQTESLYENLTAKKIIVCETQ